MKVLGIETSADDTGIALIEAEGDPPAGGRSSFKFKVLGNVVNSQSHAEYGGIYPNVAKREHIKNLPLVLEKVLLLAKESVSRPNIDTIAVTVGPGLEPCLWTGISFAQELSKKWSASRRMPIIPVNHMEGHIVLSMMEISGLRKSRYRDLRSPDIGERLHNFEFPALALLISGGHTELILMKEFRRYQYIGRTRDDAVGEAFDKVARLLELPYPGGPEISQLAERARQSEMTSHYKLPRPMMHEDNFDFSFAGLKTAVLRLVESKGPTLKDTPRSDLDEFKMKIAREFEDAVTDVLVEKTLRAVEEFGVNAVIMGGGVSANKHIRSEFDQKLKAAGCKQLACPPEFSTDNGLMIALAGYFHALKKEFVAPENLVANGSLELC